MNRDLVTAKNRAPGEDVETEIDGFISRRHGQRVREGGRAMSRSAARAFLVSVVAAVVFLVRVFLRG